MNNKNQTIELYNINIKRARIYIEGDTDLILNKMNARNTRTLTADDRKKIREVPNIWEDIITAIHWRDPLGVEDTYTACDEKMLYELLEKNAPCITAFGLKKSFGEAVTRNGIDPYRTKFDVGLSIIAKDNLVPITFAEHAVDKRLMSPQKGSPVTVMLNHFIGWKANFEITYSEHVYSLEQFVNFINLAGFGLGIGSGRSSGYGRYHVVGVEQIG